MKLWKFVAVAGALAMATPAFATTAGVRLTDGDAVFDVQSGGAGSSLPATSSTSGTSITSNFRVAGGTTGADNQFTDWWWYRLPGDTRERNFHSPTTGDLTTKTLIGTNAVVYGFNNMVGAGAAPVAGVSAAIRYTLTDTGADSANIDQQVSITNTTGAPLVIDLFRFMDVFLGNQDAGDSVDAMDTMGGTGVAWHIRDTTSTTTPTWYGNFAGPGAVGGGAGGFSLLGGQVADTNLDNFLTPVNPGGVAAADNSVLVQFRLTIPDGETWTVGSGFCAVRNIAIGQNVPGNSFCTATPEPGTLSLLALAGLAMIRRRR